MTDVPAGDGRSTTRHALLGLLLACGCAAWARPAAASTPDPEPEPDPPPDLAPQSERIKRVAVASAASCLTPVFAELSRVQIYGVVGLGVMSTVDAAGKRSHEVLNESRICLRGAKELRKLGGARFIWQIESGFLGPNGLTARPYESGTLGTRDTWAGLEGAFGAIRLGRLLTPYGETLDWPFATGGVNPLVEATSVPGGGSYVRVSDQVRWDFPRRAGLTGSVSFGRGDRDVASDNGFVAEKSWSFSSVGPYTLAGATLHVGFEGNGYRSSSSDNTNWLLAVQSPSLLGFSLYGAYIRGLAELFDAIGVYPPGAYGRGTFQMAAQFASEDWVIKLSHARNQALDGPATDAGGHITAFQILYVVDPTLVAYARHVSASNPATTVGWWNRSRVLLGVEYYF
jgi:hypothetical protein